MKKKNFLWLLIIVPALFIAASIPNLNMDHDSSGCAESGNDYDAFNGDHGCPYNYDFAEMLSCTVHDVDLDKTTSQIDHYYSTNYFEAWYTSSGVIEMKPQDGYGGAGFYATLNVRVYFDGGNSWEDEWWTCNVTAGSPPYPAPCY